MCPAVPRARATFSAIAIAVFAISFTTAGAATPGDPPGTPLEYDPHSALRLDPALSPFAAEDAILAYLGDPEAHAGTGPEYEIITLSNLAEACVHRVVGTEDDDPAWNLAGACTHRVAKIAIDRFMGGDPEGKLPGDTLLLSHLVIVLASADHAERSGAWDNATHDLLARAADRLEARLLADPDAIPPSFTADTRRWPADAAASIYALWLAEHLAPADHTDSRWKEPARRFVAWSAQRGLAGDWGLPISELTGADPAASLPRGCALSWTIRYQAAWDPSTAKRLYDRYRALFFVRMPVAGFREYPPAVDRPADNDSGPIVAGIGAAASAFGVGAARLVGDTETFSQLRASQALVTAIATGGPAKNGPASAFATTAIPGGEVADDVLARSIAVNQAALVPWFKDAK